MNKDIKELVEDYFENLDESKNSDQYRSIIGENIRNAFKTYVGCQCCETDKDKHLQKHLDSIINNPIKLNLDFLYDFHHFTEYKNDKKKLNWKRFGNDTIKELSKGIIVCKNCHNLIEHNIIDESDFNNINAQIKFKEWLNTLDDKNDLKIYINKYI